MTERRASPSRREFVGVVGAGSLAALSGCAAVTERVPFVGGDDEEDGIHEHGYLFVEIDGEAVDFSESKYVIEESDAAPEFHFHDYDEDERWHMEGEWLTLAEALDLLAEMEYAAENGAHVLTVEGEVYDERDGDEITITERTDGEIEPEEYELRDGQVIEIVVESG